MRIRTATNKQISSLRKKIASYNSKYGTSFVIPDRMAVIDMLKNKGFEVAAESEQDIDKKTLAVFTEAMKAINAGRKS